MNNSVETLVDGRYTFEIVDEAPWGYVIWNVGKNMPDGYLPFVRVGGWNGCQVDTTCMKAMKVPEAQTILAATSWGQGSIGEMEAFVKKYQSSKNESKRNHVKRLRAALSVMRTVKGIEHLDSGRKSGGTNEEDAI